MMPPTLSTATLTTSLVLALSFASDLRAQTPEPEAAETPARPEYVALVNLLAEVESADAASNDRVIDPEKAVHLFRWSDVTGGSAFTCGKTPLPASPAPIRPGIRDINRILECATDPDQRLASRLNAVDHLVAITRTPAAQRSSRYPRAITDRGDKVRVVVMHEAMVTRSKEGKTPHLVRSAAVSVQFTETARASRIATDVQTLARIAAKIATSARTAMLPKIVPAETETAAATWISEREYVLTLDRATLAIAATLSGPPTSIAASDLDDAALTIFLQQEEELRQQQAAAGALEAQTKATAAAVNAAAQIDCTTPLTLTSPPLQRLSCTLADRNNPPETRIAAAAGLSELGQPMAISALATVAGDATEPSAVRAAAITAIAKLTLPGTSATGLAAPPAAPPGSLKTTLSLSTGSTERWFLSADVPLTKETTVTTDAAGNVTGVSDPGVFYVSAGVQFGDLLTEHRNPLLNLSLKVLLKASSRPLDSYGLGLSLRGRYLSKFGIDFDLVSPFVAVLSTRELPPDSQQLPTSSSRHTSVVGGLGLNLDTALGWLK